MIKDCNTCIHKEGSCYPSTTIFDNDKTCKSYDPDYEGYIADLEKENAELKAVERMALYSKLSDQLAKAKDLIEDMYDKIPASHSDYYKDVMERARQFIKEIEK